MTQKTPTKQTAKKDEPKQPVSQAKSTTVQKLQPEKGVPKSEEVKVEGTPKPKAVEPKLSDIKLILDALTATILDHTRQIAELQEALARKRKPVPNGKVQIRDKQTGKVYPSKNNCYQSLLKAGALKGKEMTGTDAEACAYLYTAALTQPMDHDWSQIYLYVAGKTYSRHKGNQMPDDIQVESLNGYQMGELNRLKEWFYRKRTQVRLERNSAERRQKLEEEAEKKKAEQPALFEF